MDQHATVELVGATCLVATGISHWMYPKSWSALFQQWAAEGIPGAFKNALLHATVGALFVATHPVFTGRSSILTYWAAAVFAKGLFYLVAPGVGVQSMQSLTPERSERLRWMGVPMVILGLIIGVGAWS
jgi:uncharacterized protein YjeT (DUF2065 family)